jgi:hypothetical protein
MISEENVQLMCEAYRMKYGREYKFENMVYIPMQKFCDIVKVEKPQEPLNFLAELQKTIDEIQNNPRLILGYSAPKEELHWHLVAQGERDYETSVEHLHATGPSPEVRKIHNMFVNEERRRFLPPKPKDRYHK